MSALAIAIPTYRRGAVVLDTITALLALGVQDCEILIVDQTEDHPAPVAQALQQFAATGAIAWIRLSEPSIPAAMNVALQRASAKAVLFLDDDIIPGPALVAAHVLAQQTPGLVAGLVLQPGQQKQALGPGEPFRFNSTQPALVDEFMGGNFSVDRALALGLGGFDENFRGAAYRFEAEFAHRWVKAFGAIRYQPDAVINHLAISVGGTRAYGSHLKTMQPSHSVGAYYYLFRARPRGWWKQVIWRPLRAIRTRHHLRRPWWIPATLIGEARGLLLALVLLGRGPKLLDTGRTY